VNYRKFISILALAFVSSVGCERRASRSSLPNLVVPASCASEITLLHCDARVSPPKCAGARVRYRNGCEQILLGATAKAKP
jgi:hypothetical protein